MNNNWKLIRSLVESQANGKELFLVVIREDGRILSANNSLLRVLDIREETLEQQNFFRLIHPFYQDAFFRGMEESRTSNLPYSVELSLKNGYYHPMKWQVNSLPDAIESNAYLCVGHKILDESRFMMFNKLGEENYHTILETLGQAVIFTDLEGELIAANIRAAELLQVSLETLYRVNGIRKRWEDQLLGTDELGRPVSFDDVPFYKAARTGQLQEAAIQIRLSNGLRWIHYNSHPLFENGQSTPYAVVTYLTDITDQKQLTTTLQEHEAIINQFIRESPNLAWIVDEEMKLVFASNSFYNYFKLDAAAVAGRKINEIVPPEVAEALYTRHLEVLTTASPVEVIEKARKADGRSFVFHIHLFPIEGISHRRLLGGHASSLSEKFAIEERLREANDRLLLLSRATTDAIWEWDMQTGKVFRNDALMDMIGYQLDNPKGLSWWFRRIHPDDRNRISDIVKESTDNGRQSWQDEYRFKCADGSYKIMRDRGYIVYENGLPVKMIGSLQDVTEMRKLENKLMEEKLQRQKELSETVIRVQEKERTRIGHELHDNVNQILSTTKLFVDMLHPSDEQEKLLKEKSVNYLLQAIEEIRKLSKELVVPQLKEKGLMEGIQQLISDIHISTKVKVNFKHDLEADLLSPGIRVTLFRIVQEQLKNVLRHSQASEVDIILQLRGEEAQLSVRDNGVGFDASIVSRGIGLSNIHERTRFYGGTVNVDSAPGRGCLLEVRIPVGQ